MDADLYGLPVGVEVGEHQDAGDVEQGRPSSSGRSVGWKCAGLFAAAQASARLRVRGVRT
ncbi:hypothetical protein OG381_47030 [Streptomyces sp. NBC_00490]|uniref:hypothetical protein n=1 Tax=Streptomyces sp. NBC_00490 TaxID=2903657 RepID=UPI002E1743AB